MGDPVLRQVARPVRPEELAGLQPLIDDLIETMHAAKGAGLAAPQIGEPVAIAAVHVQANPRYPYKPDIPLTVFVNPRITVLDEASEWIYEGCLSVPDLRGLVPRAMHIRVEALDRHGEALDFEARGLSAGTFQHEFDHLEGRLFLDRVADPATLCTWANFERFHKAGFVARAEEIVARWGS